VNDRAARNVAPDDVAAARPGFLPFLAIRCAWAATRSRSGSLPTNCSSTATSDFSPCGSGRIASSPSSPRTRCWSGRSPCAIHSSSISGICRPSPGTMSAGACSGDHRSTRGSTRSSTAGSTPTSTTPPAATPHPEVPDGWPDVDDVLAYRDRVRSEILKSLAEVATSSSTSIMAENDRAVLMALEHEQMHQETLLYIVQQLAAERKVRPRLRPLYPMRDALRSRPIEIPGGPATLARGGLRRSRFRLGQRVSPRHRPRSGIRDGLDAGHERRVPGVRGGRGL